MIGKASEQAGTRGRPIEVLISFSRPDGPVTGTIRPPGGGESRFHGWLELMDALEETRSASSSRAEVDA